MKELKLFLGNLFVSTFALIAFFFILSPFVMIYYNTIRCKIICTCPLDKCVKSVRVGYEIRLDDHNKYCNDNYEGCWKK